MKSTTHRMPKTKAHRILKSYLLENDLPRRDVLVDCYIDTHVTATYKFSDLIKTLYNLKDKK